MAIYQCDFITDDINRVYKKYISECLANHSPSVLREEIASISAKLNLNSSPVLHGYIRIVQEYPGRNLYLYVIVVSIVGLTTGQRVHLK